MFRSLLFLVVFSFLIGLIGCRACYTPYDPCQPTFVPELGDECKGELYRAGSILGGKDRLGNTNGGCTTCSGGLTSSYSASSARNATAKDSALTASGTTSSNPQNLSPNTSLSAKNLSAQQAERARQALAQSTGQNKPIYSGYPAQRNISTLQTSDRIWARQLMRESGLREGEFEILNVTDSVVQAQNLQAPNLPASNLKAQNLPAPNTYAQNAQTNTKSPAAIKNSSENVSENDPSGNNLPDSSNGNAQAKDKGFAYSAKYPDEAADQNPAGENNKTADNNASPEELISSSENPAGQNGSVPLPSEVDVLDKNDRPLGDFQHLNPDIPKEYFNVRSQILAEDTPKRSAPENLLQENARQPSHYNSVPMILPR